MSTTVNLLPNACHEQLQRLRRMHGWSFATVALVLVLLFAGAQFLYAHQQLEDLRSNLAALEAARADCERELTLAIQREETLVAQARVLTALRAREPLPRQLEYVAQAAPANVLFSTFTVDRLPPAQPEPDKQKKTLLAKKKDAEQKQGAAAPVLPPTQTAPLQVSIAGFAMTHDEITALVQTLRSLPGWHDVELQRVAQESVEGGHILAFGLVGRWREGTP